MRKNRASSGLIRYEGRNEREDWAQAIREAIAATKPKFIVMMVGLNDRISIRDRVVPPAAPAAAPGAAASKTPASPAAPPEQPAAAPAPKADAADAEQTPAEPPAIIASEPQPRAGSAATRTYEFRSDEWAASYTKRIDATIAALKSAGVPVFWVGLPSIRGPKSTSDVQYLNDLYRARVEKAGLATSTYGTVSSMTVVALSLRALTSRARSAGCVPATACISPGPARASSRTISSAKSAA